jgi:hypothetical protein
MNLVPFTRPALCIGAALFLLAGCGGSQSQPGVPSTALQNSTTERRGTTGTRHHATTITRFTAVQRNVLLDGKPFFIKGVDYGTAQIDSLYDQAPVANPLDNAYNGIWQKDLDLMRADGVNAVKVYNVTLASFKGIPNYEILAPQQPFPKETGKIDEFLDAAWNNGDNPIYVVLSLQFGGADALQPDYKKALAAAFKIMASEYGSYPALMGISIGNEINSRSLIIQPGWWKALNDLNAGIKAGFKEANGAKKLSTTTMIDGVENIEGKDYLETVYYGEKYGFKVDAWGIDVYRGPSFGSAWEQIKRSTTKPTIIAEYGSTAAYYPASTAKHGTNYSCIDYPQGTDKAPYYGLPPPRPWEGAAELRSGANNPGMQNLIDYVTTNQQEVYANSTLKGGVDSGGFYFEFNDEWWKSGWSHKHIGGFIGNKITANAEFAGCYDDEAWFGLYGNRKSGVGDKPYPLDPGRNPDIRVARPTRNAIKAEWAKEE